MNFESRSIPESFSFHYLTSNLFDGLPFPFQTPFIVLNCNWNRTKTDQPFNIWQWKGIFQMTTQASIFSNSEVNLNGEGTQLEYIF